MSKKVVLVGHCGPDSSYLRMAVNRADREIAVLAADDQDELDAVLAKGADLLLLNRELPYGFDETMGVEVIRRLRGQHPNIQMMLVSNYPDAQAAAVRAGAVPGFGKREIGSAKVGQVIRQALGLETTAERG